MNINQTAISTHHLLLNIDSEYLQAILSRINETDDNKLADMQWNFAKCTVDFNSIENLKNLYPEWYKRITCDLALFSKVLFLTSFENGGKGSSFAKRRFDSIIKTLFYLAERNQQQIVKVELDNYISYLLMYSMHDGIPTKRLVPLSFKAYSFGISNHHWVQTIKRYQLPPLGFISTLSDSLVLKTLKSTIETLSAGDLTFQDWAEGGSFNHLTLNYGCFYVEHSALFFERHINMAIAIRFTLDKADYIIKQAGLSENKSRLQSFFKACISQFISGKKVADLKPYYLERLQEKWWAAIHKITLDVFEENLRPIRVLEKMLCDQEINVLAHQVGINPHDINKLDWLKYLIELKWYLLNQEYGHSLSELISLERQCLMTVIGDVIDVKNINEMIDITYHKLMNEVEVTLPTTEFFEAVGILEGDSRYTPIYNFMRLVEDAGIINFVAVTGWRESEFGFGLKDIKIQPNLDLLDQHACPIRYEIQWVVPKTNANTKVKREITTSAYRCAIKLAQLVNTDEGSPCLYSFNANAKNPKESGDYIYNAVPNLWCHFVNYYVPFSQLDLLDELNILKRKANLSPIEYQRFMNLNKRYDEENWETLEHNQLLIEAHHRSRQELERVMFFLNWDIRRGFVWDYHTRQLSTQLCGLLDKHLSQETKDAIQALNSKSEVTPGFTRAVTNEFLGDCLYPTPHALRHMWAEAVYRRFDGDLGWMIRSNFKHINQNMWLAYIRNKDNFRQHNRVKREVISSLLGNYVRKKGAGYAGAIDKFLRRLFLHTQTLTIEQLNVAIEQYGLIEIEDIKSNPWGYCILRKRGQHHAKCAEQGVPQRHNASPALCLGCTNNLSQSGNIDGILLGISNDINVIINTKVPISFRRTSFQTVKFAYNQLKKLNIDQNSLIELETTLEIGIESGLL